ncbi:MAG: hypothetical protein IJZ15_04415 [Oscillospiraceae bacterium]|nr:hypothetical protein [Oscillospiraceae bacterium]
MMKRILAVFLCSTLLFCFTACNESTNANLHPTESTTQKETINTESVDTTAQPTKPTTEATESPTQHTEAPTQPTEAPTQETKTPTKPTEVPTKPSEPPTEPPTDPPTDPPTEPVPTENNTENQASAIFNTKNIKRITLYAYYGAGKGSDVPAENLDEIIAWLNSFAIDEEAPELLPPGTNTIHVEIEYSDGTIIKQGTDITIIDGVTYYLSSDSPPDCYEKILSKVSIF